MRISSMKKDMFLMFGSAASVLILSLSACTSATSQSANQPDNSMTQAPSMAMPGMDHSGMNHGATMNMELGPKDTSFDLRFIDGMIPHHQGAVEMAQEALTKSQRPEIQQLAQQIVAAQEKEIAELQAWRKAWYPSQDATPMMYDTSMGHMMPMTQEMRDSMMMKGDLGTADEQFDLRFINAMIPHHQGAIDMANQALQNSDRSEIKTLAQNIITSQQQEIDQMQQWRKAWYGQ
jgi:uncharacterized protein (DUF305 family)